jgi:hypothetical protein
MNDTNKDIINNITEAVSAVDANEVLTTEATTTVKLPSNGLMNPSITQVTLKRMSTQQAKTLYTSKDPNFLTSLIKGCVVVPTNFSLNDVHPNDVIYLCFMLRYISTPKNLQQKVICSECGNMYDTTVSIPSLEVKYSEYTENNFKVALTDSKDVLTFRVLSEGEIQHCEQIARRRAKQKDLSGDDVVWEILLSKVAYMITSKNGEPFDDFDSKYKYIQDLSAYDFETFNKVYTETTESFGLVRKFMADCPKCGCSDEVEAYIAPDFFRLV